MSYDIRIYEHPLDAAFPRRVGEIGPLVERIEQHSPGPNSKFVAFAERLTQKYPSQAMAKRPDQKYAWIGNTVEEARTFPGAVFSFSLNLDIGFPRLWSAIVEAAAPLDLCVLDEQTGTLWLPWGRTVSAVEYFGVSWARESMKLFAKKVPRKGDALRAVVMPELEEIFASRGCAPSVEKHGFAHWQKQIPIGTAEVCLFLGEPIAGFQIGFSWNYLIAITNPQTEAVAAKLLSPFWAGGPTFTIDLHEAVYGHLGTFGSVCSPESMRFIPRAATQLLFPLLDRLTSLAALDEVLNESTVNPDIAPRPGHFLVAPLADQRDGSSNSMKPLIVAWLARSPRFETVAEAKRRRDSTVEEFLVRLRSEVPPIA